MADTIKLTPEQQEAIAEINRNLQIIACAGSGKTEVITRRIANILQNKPGISPENIVAFTFTEKAAASMKSRIAKTLGEQSSLNINRMYIGTIHGFCASNQASAIWAGVACFVCPIRASRSTTP